MTAGSLTAARSGVYRTPADLESLRENAGRAGVAWIDIDVTRVRSKTELLAALAAACAFPPGFGHNWDALADAVGDFSWRSAQGHVLHARGSTAAERALGTEWNTFVDVLRAAANEWRARGKPFVAFIDSATLPDWPGAAR